MRQLILGLGLLAVFGLAGCSGGGSGGADEKPNDDAAASGNNSQDDQASENDNNNEVMRTLTGVLTGIQLSDASVSLQDENNIPIASSEVSNGGAFEIEFNAKSIPSRMVVSGGEYNAGENAISNKGSLSFNITPAMLQSNISISISIVADVSQLLCSEGNSYNAECLQLLIKDANQDGQINSDDIIDENASFVTIDAESSSAEFSHFSLIVKNADDNLRRISALSFLKPKMQIKGGSYLEAPLEADVIIKGLPSSFNVKWQLDGVDFESPIKITDVGNYTVRGIISKDGNEFGTAEKTLVAYTSTQVAEEIVTPLGGSIYLYEDEVDNRLAGSELTIPEGALLDNKSITISVADNASLDVADSTQLSETFIFKPSGLVFEKPVSVRIPMLSDRNDGLHIARTTESGEVDYLEPTKIKDGFIYFETDHFSTYEVVNKEVAESLFKGTFSKERVNVLLSDFKKFSPAAFALEEFNDFDEGDWAELLSVKLNPWDDESITALHMVEERLTKLKIVDAISRDGTTGSDYQAPFRGYLAAYDILYPGDNVVENNESYEAWKFFSNLASDPIKTTVYELEKESGNKLLGFLYTTYGVLDKIATIGNTLSSIVDNEIPFTPTDVTKVFYNKYLDGTLDAGTVFVTAYNSINTNCDIKFFFAETSNKQYLYEKYDQANEVVEGILSTLGSEVEYQLPASQNPVKNGELQLDCTSKNLTKKKQFWINVLGLHNAYYQAIEHESGVDGDSYEEEIISILKAANQELSSSNDKYIEPVSIYVNFENVVNDSEIELCSDEALNLSGEYQSQRFQFKKDLVEDNKKTTFLATLSSGDVGTGIEYEDKQETSCYLNSGSNNRTISCSVLFDEAPIPATKVARNFELNVEAIYNPFFGRQSTNSNYSVTINPRMTLDLEVRTGAPVDLNSEWKIPFTIFSSNNGSNVLNDLEFSITETSSAKVRIQDDAFYVPKNVDNFDIEVLGLSKNRCVNVNRYSETIEVPKDDSELPEVPVLTLENEEQLDIEGNVGSVLYFYLDVSSFEKPYAITYDLNGDGRKEKTAPVEITSDGLLKIAHFVALGEYKPSIYINEDQYQYQNIIRGIIVDEPINAAPTDLNVRKIGDQEFEATWIPVDNAQTYSLYFATESFAGLTDPANLTANGADYVTGITGTSYQLTGLVTDATYYVVVTATDALGNESAPSNEVSITLAADQPVACESDNTALGVALFGVPASAVPPVTCTYLAETCGGKPYNQLLPGVDAHAGLDYAGSLGQQVYSPINAIVKVVDADNGRVGLRELMPDGSESPDMFFFEHLNTINDAISVDKKVSKRTPIGGVGMKGNASGVHLHIEYRENYSSEFLVGNTSCGSNQCDSDSVAALTKNPTAILGCRTEEEVDSDSDGHSNSDELSAGSDPFDSLSTPFDLDGDGVPNQDDAYPNDPTRSEEIVQDLSLTFISENLTDGTTLSLGSSYTKSWTLSYRGTEENITINAVPVDVSALNNSDLTPLTYTLSNGDSKTFTVEIDVPTTMAAGEYKSSWKLLDNSGAPLSWSNGNAAVISYSVVVPEPDALQGGIHLAPQSVSANQDLSVLLTLNSGQEPFSITYDFGDGASESVQGVDSNTALTTHTYSQPGEYTISAYVVDAADQSVTLSATAYVVDKENTVARWSAIGTEVDTGETASELPITVSLNGESQRPYYLVDWTPSTPSTNFFTRLTLPVAGGSLDLSKKLRVTAITEADRMNASYDRYIGLTTDAGFSYYSSILADTSGFIRELNFNTGENTYDYNPALQDQPFAIAAESRAYVVEVNGTELKTYRYNNSEYELLDIHSSSDLRNSGLVTLEFGFKGTGYLKAVVLEYDQNDDGVFGSDEKHLLVTENEQFDWAPLAEQEPTGNQVSSFDIIEAGFYLLEFDDVYDQNENQLTIYKEFINSSNGIFQQDLNEVYLSSGWVSLEGGEGLGENELYRVVLKESGWAPTNDLCFLQKKGLQAELTCDSYKKEIITTTQVDLTGQLVRSHLEAILSDSNSLNSNEKELILDAISTSNITASFSNGSFGYSFIIETPEPYASIDCGAINLNDLDVQWSCDTAGSYVAMQFDEIIGQDWNIRVDTSNDDVRVSLAGSYIDDSGNLIDINSGEVVGYWTWKTLKGERFVVMYPENYDGFDYKLLAKINDKIVDGNYFQPETKRNNDVLGFNEVSSNSFNEVLDEIGLPIRAEEQHGNDDLYGINPLLSPQIDFSDGTIHQLIFLTDRPVYDDVLIIVYLEGEEICRETVNSNNTLQCDDINVEEFNLTDMNLQVRFCSSDICIDKEYTLSDDPVVFADSKFEDCIQRELGWDGIIPESALLMPTELSCDISELQNVPEASRMLVSNLMVENRNLIPSWTVPAFNLTNLEVAGLGLTELNLSSLPKLQFLSAEDNQLENIDLTNNTELDSIRLGFNQLSSLDLSSLTKLRFIEAYQNRLISLDLSRNSLLENIHIDQNQLTNLDLSRNTELRYVYVDDNDISILNISNLPLLYGISARGNQLTSLDLSGKTELRYVNVGNNSISYLDLSDSPLLEGISAWDNQLTSLDLTGKTELRWVDVDGNDISFLDLSDSPLLEGISAMDNQLTSLDLAGKPELRSVYVGGNDISYLDLSDSPLLESIYASNNQLTSLDLAGKTELRWVSVDGNDISYLDLSDSSLLENISASNNQLSNIDLMEKPFLNWVNISGNNLTSLNITNSPMLFDIDAGYNEISFINLSGAPELHHLYLGSNSLSDIDLSGNEELFILDITDNPLDTIDVSNNPNLIDLRVDEGVEVLY